MYGASVGEKYTACCIYVGGTTAVLRVMVTVMSLIVVTGCR